ncbi:MAG TPA: hypothetical protein PKN23_03480 [Candidatus Hydrogenedentes bacterium]|nr:hypothetical protein [Candidatus Hydrogenedentota bacterium]
MNPKIRALMWEELRAGGAIAAVSLASGMLCVAVARVHVQITVMNAKTAADALRLSAGLMSDFREILHVFTLGVPAMCALLLIFSVGNSGHLSGGFSRRVLHLPVTTHSAVAVSLFLRLAGVMLLTVALMLFASLLGFPMSAPVDPELLGHAARGHVRMRWAVPTPLRLSANPAEVLPWFFAQATARPWSSVLLLGLFYLAVQLFDWLRKMSLPVAVLAFVTLFAVPVNPTAMNWLAAHSGAYGTGMPPAFALFFLAAVAVSYLAGWGMVRQYRCGEGFPGYILPRLRDYVPDLHFGTARPLRSPASALFWHELRLSRWLMPVLVLPFTAVFAGVMVLAGPTGGRLMQLTVFAPLLGLLAAAFVWNLRMTWRNRPRKIRRADFDMRLPVPRAEVARARMMAALANLAVAVGLIWVLHTATFLFADGTLVPRLFWEGLGSGATSPREVAVILFAPFLLAAAAAWLVMHLPTRLLLPVLVVGVVGYLIVSLFQDRSDLMWRLTVNRDLRHAVNWALDRTPFFLMVLAVVGLPVTAAAGVRMGRLAPRRAAVMLALWAALVVLLYPFSLGLNGTDARSAAFLCLAFGAALVLPWPVVTLTLGREGLRARMDRENPAQHARFAAGEPRPARLRRAVGVVLLFGLLAWMRWPADPAWKTLLRERGLPTSWEALNAWYPPVPPEKNLAKLYVKAAADNLPRDAEHSVENPERMQRTLIVGEATLERRKPVEEDVLANTREWYAKVGAPTAAALHAAARSGLTEGRHDVNLSAGFSVLLPHLARMRQLARVLAVESLLAAMDNRGGDAVTAALDIVPMAHSLAEEPLLISQLVRAAILGIAVGASETALNRADLTDADLLRLQEGLAAAVPPMDREPMFRRALLAEYIMNLPAPEMMALSRIRAESVRLPRIPLDRLRGVPGPVGGDTLLYWQSLGTGVGEGFSGMSEVGALVTCWSINSRMGLLEERSADGVLQDFIARLKRSRGNVPDGLSLPESDMLAARATIAYITLPALARAFEAEWRIRTQIGLARTAAAVERFRLANGRLPERLEELVPTFLDRVPVDPWNKSNPVTYKVRKAGDLVPTGPERQGRHVARQVREDGEFVVYSYGQNLKDDGGGEMDSWWHEGDMTFTVAPPEVRAELRIPSPIVQKKMEE